MQLQKKCSPYFHCRSKLAITSTFFFLANQCLAQKPWNNLGLSFIKKCLIGLLVQIHANSLIYQNQTFVPSILIYVAILVL